MRFGYLLESPQRGDSNKYPKHVLLGNKNKAIHFLHTCVILSIKDSLQKQIHYNDNIFGNKLYVVITMVHCTSAGNLLSAKVVSLCKTGFKYFVCIHSPSSVSLCMYTVFALNIALCA